MRELERTGFGLVKKNWRKDFPMFPGHKRAYLASSLTNVPDLEKFRQHLESVAKTIEEEGWAATVPHKETDPVKNPDVHPRTVYEKDIKKVAGSSLVIADVTTPSFGAGMEFEVAKSVGLPILALAEKDAKLSRMILGHPNLVALMYYDSENALQFQEDFRKAFENFQEE